MTKFHELKFLIIHPTEQSPAKAMLCLHFENAFEAQLFATNRMINIANDSYPIELHHRNPLLCVIRLPVQNAQADAAIDPSLRTNLIAQLQQQFPTGYDYTKQIHVEKRLPNNPLSIMVNTVMFPRDYGESKRSSPRARDRHVNHTNSSPLRKARGLALVAIIITACSYALLSWSQLLLTGLGLTGAGLLVLRQRRLSPSSQSVPQPQTPMPSSASATPVSELPNHYIVSPRRNLQRTLSAIAPPAPAEQSPRPPTL